MLPDHLHGFLDGTKDRCPSVLDPLHGGGHSFSHQIERLEGGDVIGHDDGGLFLSGALALNLHQSKDMRS